MAENQEPQTPEELVKYIASNLVENTDEIKIETVEEENKIILKLTVDENDKGKIIGKNGKIAKHFGGPVSGCIEADFCE